MLCQELDLACFLALNVILEDMNSPLELIFSRLRQTADFARTDFSDVNATCSDGDNALHCVVRWDDLTAAKVLIDGGVDINKAGDLGYTPLHAACMKGNAEMVKLLVDKGADLFALSEGDPPFTTARGAGHNHVCELLAPLMEKARTSDPKVWSEQESPNCNVRSHL
jgi:ankyrin repeat protein